MPVNKVVFGDEVLIDLTSDTVTEESLLKGYVAHKADGSVIMGAATGNESLDDILDSGFKLGNITTKYTNDSRTITSREENGRTLVKEFSEDLNTCVTTLSDTDGETITQSITTISSDGFTVMTRSDNGKTVEKIFDADFSHMTATIKESDGSIICTINANLKSE